MDARDKWFFLIQEFPVMGAKLGATPEPETLAQLYASASHGEQLIISFLLAVWGGENMGEVWQEDYGVAPFDFIEATMILSSENLQPVLAWARNPFWP